MSWKAEYVILIIISTLVDYIVARGMHKSKKKSRRKAYLSLSLFVNLGLLFSFKYWNFFSDSLRELLSLFTIPFQQTTLNVLLPIGISFYTFQTLSYTIDVYRKKIKPEKHLGIFAVYVSFFPQLVAGPIERAKHLLPQFFEKHKFDFKKLTSGLRLMLWGFFKKIVIADRLALVVDSIFMESAATFNMELIFGVFLFGFQIYADFSGYTDIAIGAARIMGFNLMENFKRPYSAKSVAEFWRRWHISLSTWFRDYIYIPLGGNRVSVRRWYLNIAIVFLITGLWHGANWTFVFWGILHGCYIMFSKATINIRENLAKLTRLAKFPKFHTFIKILITFTLVNFAWLFFRANSFSHAFYILKIMFTFDALKVFGYLFYLFFAFTPIIFLGYMTLLKRKAGGGTVLSKKVPSIKLQILLSIIIFSFFIFHQVKISFYHLLIVLLSVIFMNSLNFLSEKVKWLEWVKYFLIIATLILLFEFVISFINLPYVLILILFMEYLHFIQEKNGLDEFLLKKSIWFRWSIYYSIILIMLLFGVFENIQFIYFQF